MKKLFYVILFFAVSMVLSCGQYRLVTKGELDNQLTKAQMQSAMPPEMYETILKALEGTGATKIRAFTALEGDTTGTLDRIDIADLSDGDIGIVVTAAGGFYVYVFDADDTTTSEQSPYFIYPNDYTTTGVWKLVATYYAGRSAQPAVILRDSGATDFDDNFKLYADCNDGSCSSGSEDVDVYLQAQVGGTLTTFIHFDCDASGNCDIDFTPAGSGGVLTSVVWVGGGMVPDGTQCSDTSSVQINSGPYQYTIVCADNDASTIYGSLQMPDSWVIGADITFELAVIQTAADTANLDGDITIQCRGSGETVNNTWESEATFPDAAAVTGSNAVDHFTSAVFDTANCVAGDTLYWRWQMDATGTTTAVATLHFVGMKMEYTTSIGD